MITKLIYVNLKSVLFSIVALWIVASAALGVSLIFQFFIFSFF